ncbi:Lipid-A-disaccharide synthase [gamma proteobacterium IMCC2047]|nr:Lipid-A-disaccharide synthase [gamma proteobacterium IMCC2047]
MIAEGFHSYVPMERLSVMGLFEVLSRLFELLKIRKNLVRHFIDNPPDVFVGIDAPDFNLQLENKLKKAGIKTIQYVSPQVWAWRQNRVKHIAESVNQVLALLPFEQTFYRDHQVPVTFVGHPLADTIDLETPQRPARERLELAADDKILALLPGSRSSEVKKLAATFLGTALYVQRQMPDCKILIAALTEKTSALIAEQLAEFPDLKHVQISVGQSRDVMAAADALLVASGTVTLEAALLKRPMVVAYKVSKMTYRIARKMIKVDHIALANLLSKKPMVPEFIQDEASPENLSQALLTYMNDEKAVKAQTDTFMDIHLQLRQNASAKAAEAVLGEIGLLVPAPEGEAEHVAV